MSTTDFTRTEKGLLSRFVGFFTSPIIRKPIRKAKPPAWLADPELCAQLTRDTGLSPEELSGCTVWDASQPFFMQRNFW